MQEIKFGGENDKKKTITFVADLSHNYHNSDFGHIATTIEASV